VYAGGLHEAYIARNPAALDGTKLRLLSPGPAETMSDPASLGDENPVAKA